MIARGDPRAQGFVVVEVIVALTLTALLLSMLVGTAAMARRTVERLARSAERTEAARLARTLADRVGRPASTMSAVDGRAEVRVRLSIGWGESCDSVFTWAGIRAPDARRDSATVVDRWGRVHVVAVASSAVRPCGAGEGRVLTTDPSVRDAVLLRVFESGVIRIDDAVRYARWGTPRQPLSAASLDARSSGVDLAGGELRMHVRGREGGEWARGWHVR